MSSSGRFDVTTSSYETAFAEVIQITQQNRAHSCSSGKFRPLFYLEMVCDQIKEAKCPKHGRQLKEMSVAILAQEL